MAVGRDQRSDIAKLWAISGEQGSRTRVRKRQSPEEEVCSRLAVGRVSKAGDVKLSLRHILLLTGIPDMMGNAPFACSFLWISHERSIQCSLYVKRDAREMQSVFQRAGWGHRTQEAGKGIEGKRH